MQRSNEIKAVPRYVQVKSYLKNQITSGSLQQGMPIPTEKWLEAKFNVSRVTVRKAIQDLVDEGVLLREKGKSPVVPGSTPIFDLNYLYGISESLHSEGREVSAEVKYFGKLVPSSSILDIMGLPPQSNVVFIDRTRYADGTPIVIQNIYLNPAYATGITEENLKNESLYTTLERNGTQISWGTQEFFAVMPTPEQAERLQIDVKKPILNLVRRSYTQNGDMFEYVKTYFDSDRYSPKIRLSRKK